MSPRVLILFAHPAPHRSRVNRRMIEAARGLDRVTIHDLYEVYPNLHIRVAREQELLLAHDVIVFHHPFYWYSSPAILKEWMDLVLEYGFAYGNKGVALAGKKLLSAITTGGGPQAYAPSGLNRFTIREFLRPFEQTAHLCHMTYLPPFVVQGTHVLDDAAIERHAERYRDVIVALRDGRPYPVDGGVRMTGGFFFQAFVYLAAAVVSVPIAKRLGLGSVLGYLAAGAVIGPHVLGLIGDHDESVMHVAEFGVVMMLFLIGLELRPSLLWGMRRPLLGLGGLQLLGTTLVVTAASVLLGTPWKQGVALGLIASMSSTAIALQILQEKGLLKSVAGRNAFAVLLFQDISVIPVLAVLPVLALAGPAAGVAHESGSETARGLLIVGAVVAIVVAGRFLVRPVFRFIAETKLREIFTATALLLVIAIALVMEQVGLSAALGAFLGGVVLADSEYRHELESDIEPFKGLLLGLFFISVGAGINFDIVVGNPVLIAGLTLGLMALKALVLLGLGAMFGMKRRENVLVAILLAQGGEFAFVLFSFAMQQNVLTPEVVQPCIAAVAMSMALTPLVLLAHERFTAARSAKTAEAPADVPEASTQGVIIAGFGRFGQVVGRMLLANGIRPAVFEVDPAQIEMLRRFGFTVFYGNAAREDLLRAAGAAEAKLMIVAVDDAEAAVQMVELVKRSFPRLAVVARAIDRTHAYALQRAGADTVIRETFGSAIETGVEAMKRLGYGAHRALRIGRLFREHDEAAMAAMAGIEGDEKAYVVESRRQFALLEQILGGDRPERGVHGDDAWDAEELRRDVLGGGVANKPPGETRESRAHRPGQCIAASQGASRATRRAVRGPRLRS